MEATVTVCLFAAALAKPEGYHYPQPPFQFDETPSLPPTYVPPQDEVPFQQIAPTYLPPNIYPPIGTPPLQDEIQPPLDDTIVNPPVPAGPQYLPPANQKIYDRSFRIFNMSCLETKDGAAGFFRAVVQTSSRSTPVFDASPTNCVATAAGLSAFRVDLEGQRLGQCGVVSCGAKMCLNMRMATVTGLRLADDPVISLQCAPQDAVVAHTNHLRINAQSDQNRSGARSVNVASGGGQRRFETYVNLLRKSGGGGGDVFDQPVQQGGAVRLGDELMLRAAIRDGDGWRFGRMGAVVVRSTASQRTVTLVDDDGCRRAAVRSVCPRQPQQMTPLVVQLPFRAFLFQGAAPADDLMVSVRMLGCLRPKDCFQKICEDDAQVRTRFVRSPTNSTEPSLMTDWEGDFRFRVLPNDEPIASNIPTTYFLLASGLVGAVAVLICVAIAVLARSRRF